MALMRIGDFDPNYGDAFEGNDLKGFGVYTEADEKVGNVADLLVDEATGQFRYFIVDLGFWIFGKKVLLPVGRSRMDYDAERVYALGFTKQQAENLPEFREDLAIDYEHEESVRGVYRSAPVVPMTGQQPGVTSDVETAAASRAGGAPVYDRETYSYDREPDLYQMRDQDHQKLRLYEERLIANKRRAKTGEVAVGKHVETETARASVPIAKERVVVERTTPAQPQVAPGEATFESGEVARIETYEERPEIRKETVLREEVTVRKETEQDRVEVQEQLRREELDINADERTRIERPE